MSTLVGDMSESKPRVKVGLMHFSFISLVAYEADMIKCEIGKDEFAPLCKVCGSKSKTSIIIN